MNPPVHTVRRATINDLEALRTIWQEERFAMGELERRFTEFQIVEDAEGRVIGALGLHIHEKQGLLHSEAIADPAHTDWLRQALWERLKKVADNHGLLRLWTRESATFWSQVDFKAPTEEQHGKRPRHFEGAEAVWLVLQLKEESEQAISLERELAIFREAQKAETERFHEQARMMRALATIIACIFALVVFVGGYYLLRYYRLRNEGGGTQPAQTAPVMTPPVPAPVVPPAPTNPAPTTLPKPSPPFSNPAQKPPAN